MKLRYYLRGLGIGVLVTAIVMSIALGGKKETLSDAQIRERALALGMVDGSSTRLSDLQSGDEKEPMKEGTKPTEAAKEPTGATEPTDATEPTKAAEPTKATEPTSSTNPTQSTTPTGTAKPSSSVEPTQSTTPTGTTKPSSSVEPTQSTTPTGTTKPSGSAEPTNSTKPTVTIVIKSGSGSEAVSRTLAEAGLVADAKAYDQYLCDNGYSKGLRAGTYNIPEGATEKEIAEMIATKR